MPLQTVRRPLRIVGAVGAAVAVLGVIAVIVWIAIPRLGGTPQPDVDPGETVDCPDGAPIGKRLGNGAEWAMCWSIDPYQGLVLSNIRYTPAGHEPVRLIASMALGQLEVPYDTGKRTTEDITAQGFGGRNLQSITTDECSGDIRSTYVPNYGAGKVGGGETRDVLCVVVQDTGMAFRSNQGGNVVTAQGQALVVSTISKVGWYEYINQYSFDSHGLIEPNLGATGTLSPADYTDDHHHGSAVGHGDHDHAVSHSHNAVWRIHWDLGGRGALQAEEYNAAFNGRRGPKSLEIDGALAKLPTETMRRHDDRRWWRVVNPTVRNADEHPISYEIDLHATDSYGATAHKSLRPDPDYDVAFTEYQACERFASKNPDGSCGAGVGEYLDDQKLGDIVSWVAVGFHHVPRDEDQSPMDVHWQGFSLTPRDLTAGRADPPSGYESVNGRPSATP